MIRLLFLLLLLPTTVATAAEPAIAKLIERLNLDQSAQPVSAHPQWRVPRKVVVALPGSVAFDADIRSRFRQAAGKAQVVFVDARWRRGLDADTVADADVVLGLCHPETLARARQLIWLHSFAVGVDRCLNVPKDVAEGLLVTNNQRLSGPNIAEHVMAMMLAMGRGLHRARDLQLQGRWDRSAMLSAPIREFSGRTLLVAGLGGIGTEVARRAHGLGMRVIATRHSGRHGPDFVHYVGLPHELKALAAEADVVVNALPLTEDTRDLFDGGFFRAVKPGAFFISVGRGASTVTEDLMAALREGRLAGAGLDVTDPEPLPPGHPLWAMANVIISPHMAGVSDRQRQRSLAVALENLRRYVAGERLLNPVDLSRGY